MKANAPGIINKALTAQRSLPMDGACACWTCERMQLNLADMAHPSAYPDAICKACLEDLREGYIPCRACRGTTGSYRVSDYVRGNRTEFCERCDGYQRIYVGVPKVLQQKSECAALPPHPARAGVPDPQQSAPPTDTANSQWQDFLRQHIGLPERHPATSIGE